MGRLLLGLRCQLLFGLFFEFFEALSLSCICSAPIITLVSLPLEEVLAVEGFLGEPCECLCDVGVVFGGGLDVVDVGAEFFDELLGLFCADDAALLGQITLVADDHEGEGLLVLHHALLDEQLPPTLDVVER